MSLLLGVRGSSQKNEGQSFCEGIIQQPGPFYNGNPSSSIWGNSPTPPLWRNISSVNALSSPSSSSSSSFATTSEASKSGIGMENELKEQQWHHTFATGKEIAREEVKQEEATLVRRRAEYGSKDDKVRQFVNAAGADVPSDPSISPFSFGFPPQRTSSAHGPTASNPSQFSSKFLVSELQIADKSSGRLVDEDGRKMFEEPVTANTKLKNEKSLRFAALDKYSSQGSVFGMPYSGEDSRNDGDLGLSLQGFPLYSSSAFQYPSTFRDSVSLETVRQPVENSHSASASGPGDSKTLFTAQASDGPASLSFSKSQPLSSQREAPEIFVFAASGSSGTSFKGGAPQQKQFHSSVAAPPSRMRTSKFKRHSNPVKGKGLAALGGICSQQLPSEFSRDASPLSNAGLDSATESSRFDDAECSQYSGADIWPEDNLDMSTGTSEFLQPSHWSEPKVSLGIGADGPIWIPEGLSSTANEDIHFHHNFEQEDHISHYEEKQHPKHMQNIGKHFGSWWGFSKNTEDCTEGIGHAREDAWNFFRKGMFFKTGEVGDCAGGDYTNDALVGMAKRGAPLVKPDISQVKSTVSHGEELAKQLPNQKENAAEGSKPSDGQRFNSRSSGEFPIKELCKREANSSRTDVAMNGQKENQEPVCNIGSKEVPKPFIFGSSQASKTQVDSNSGIAHGGSVTILASASKKIGNLKDDTVQESKEDSASGCEQSILPDHFQRPDDTWSSTSSFTPFDAGKNFGGAFQKGLFSAQTQPISHSAVSFTGGPSVSSFPNLNSRLAMQQYSYAELHNEIPTGEFSRPVSSSESSASESSPTRGGQWSAGDQPSFLNQCFEFQGSAKEIHTGLPMGKKKARASLNMRRHRKGINRQRRSTLTQAGMHTTSAKETTISSMDFSPCTDEATSNSGATNLEQPFLNVDSSTEHWPGLKMDDKEAWMRFAQNPSMEELRAAAANLSIGKDQGNINIQDGNQESGLLEQSNEWTGSHISSKRSGKWKRSALGEGQSASTHFENPWVRRQLGTEDEFETDDYDTFLNSEESNHRTAFNFVASSPPTLSSSMLRRHARRIQKEMAADTMKHSTSVVGIDSTSLGPDAPGTSDQGSLSKATMGADYTKGPFRVSRTSVMKTNQSFAHNKNAEELATQKAVDSGSSLPGHRFETGMPESPSAVKSAAAEQVCERWRLRGNQAYANGDFPKAEEYYSRGASSVSPDETSQSCIRASMLCYSNRAATRMAIGRMREALADCKRAMVVDPSFFRVRLRAASCHLALGESKAAAGMFKECLKYARDGNKPDPKIIGEALEGAKKAQQLDDYSDRALELLQKENFTDSTAALRLINEALSISSYSELLHDLKAQVLLSLRRYDEAVQLCEQSLPAAERNHGIAVNEQQYQDTYPSEPSQSSENLHLKLWRWRLSAKALYHLGRLDESLNLLGKHEEAMSAMLTDKGASSDSLALFAASIRDLLRHKAAGNEAFQVGKHAEAVEHYTAALACNGESRPYNAVCFCNRAAASQALGHIADAIADCSRAIALDSVYPKALSRRATLHEMIRDYGQVCNDLRRLITLLEDYQSHGKNNQASKGGGSSTNTQDLRQAQDRLAKAEEEMKKGLPVDHYLVLGVDFSCSANEIKKAYRKAALKHHPDKAGQFLARGENGDDGSLWKEVGDEVRRDAERLFKLIGEAYAILSDPTKRLRYDTEEEHRKLRAKDSNFQVSTSSASEGYRSQYEKSGRRQRDQRDVWHGYAPQHQRWQSGPDAAQPDTYARRSMYGASASKSGNTSRNADFSWDNI